MIFQKARLLRLACHALWRQRRAAVAIEFAMIAPMFFLLLLGGLEVSRYLWYRATIEYAVDSASRWSMVHVSYSQFSSQSTSIVAKASAASVGVPCAYSVAQVTTPYKGAQITGSCTFNSVLKTLIPGFSNVAISTVSLVPLN